jgi:hypothetical protein
LLLLTKSDVLAEGKSPHTVPGRHILDLVSFPVLSQITVSTGCVYSPVEHFLSTVGQQLSASSIDFA